MFDKRILLFIFVIFTGIILIVKIHPLPKDGKIKLVISKQIGEIKSLQTLRC